jgi:hypothetical protein
MCRLFGGTFDFYNFVTSAMFRVRVLQRLIPPLACSCTRA